MLLYMFETFILLLMYPYNWFMTVWQFYNASKECFWQKNFEFDACIQKCHIGNFLLLAKWHFWTLLRNSNNIFAKSILLKFWPIHSTLQILTDFHGDKAKKNLFWKKKHKMADSKKLRFSTTTKSWAIVTKTFT